jgi:hypothetical protein
MPQIGQLPGPERTISGCIGHVYSTRVADVGISGSSAIPQRGQASGLAERTSGHIGQMKAPVAAEVRTAEAEDGGIAFAGAARTSFSAVAFAAAAMFTICHPAAVGHEARYFCESARNFSRQEPQQK